MSKRKNILWWNKQAAVVDHKYFLRPINQESAYRLLYHYCRKYLDIRNISEIKKFLAEYPDLIDLTYHKGQIFSVALSCSSSELLNVLLDFYTKTKLQGPKDSDEYKEAYFQLQEALYQAMDRDNYSDSIKDILARYNIIIEDEPEIYDKDDKTIESSTDCEHDNISISDEDRSYDIEKRNGSKQSLLMGEGDIEETLLLTTFNLIFKQHPYCQVNKKAEEDYVAGDAASCLRNINGAAGAIARNSSIHANMQEKSKILYNYLKFTAELGGGLRCNSDKFLDKIWELTTNVYKETILYAIKDNNKEVVELFLQKNPALVSIVDEYGQTPLHYAANNFELMKMLLGAASSEDIMKQAECNHNYTALHLAVHAKNSDVIKLLLDKAPDLVCAADEYGQTPLHFAANNFELMQMLLDVASSEDIMKQAELNHHYTALDLAKEYQNNDVISLLLSKVGEADYAEIIKGMGDISFYKDDHSMATTYDRDSGSSEDVHLLGLKDEVTETLT